MPTPSSSQSARPRTFPLSRRRWSHRHAGGNAPDRSAHARDRIAGVFAGGDAAFPPSMLITCAQHGKLAARGIDAYLRGRPLGQPRMHVTIEEMPTDTYRDGR